MSTFRYEDMTNDDLRRLLNERGIYQGLSGKNKSELRQMLHDVDMSMNYNWDKNNARGMHWDKNRSMSPSRQNYSPSRQRYDSRSTSLHWDQQNWNRQNNRDPSGRPMSPRGMHWDQQNWNKDNARGMHWDQQNWNKDNARGMNWDQQNWNQNNARGMHWDQQNWNQNNARPKSPARPASPRRY